jgi:hypothetical protein
MTALRLNDFSLYAGDGMALSDRVYAVEQRLASLEKALSAGHKLAQQAVEALATTRKSRWKTIWEKRPIGFWEWTKWLGTFACFPALPIALIAWLQPQWASHVYHDRKSEIGEVFDSKFAPFAQQIAEQGNKLSGIEGRLDGLRDDVQLLLKKELKITASLSQPEFNKNLDVVVSALQAAANQKVAIPIEVSSTLHSKLKSSPVSAVSYWPAVGSFLTYASSISHRESPKQAESLRCEPIARTIYSHVSLGGSCYDLMDGAVLQDVHFVNTIVRFQGTMLALRNVTFSHTVFLFPLLENPSPDIRRIAAAMLKSFSDSLEVTN